MTTKPAKTAMLPYLRQGGIDCGALDFTSDGKELPPAAWNNAARWMKPPACSRFASPISAAAPMFFSTARALSATTPRNLNVRAAPGVYIAFGVDAEAIRPRKLYLPWEADKTPDWALEMASESARHQDVNCKPRGCAQTGIPEFWRFNPSGAAATASRCMADGSPGACAGPSS